MTASPPRQAAMSRSDLDCAQEIWTYPGVLGAAGLFVFLTYLSMPELTAVPLDTGGRVGHAVTTEREYMLRLLGATDDASWSGGLANPRVRLMVAETAARHRGLAGMTSEYLDLIAAIIAIAPLRVRAAMKVSAPDAVMSGYWRYMVQAMKPFGTLPDPAYAETWCEQFADVHSFVSPKAEGLVPALCNSHPDHARLARSVLFHASAQVIDELLADGHDL